MKLLPEYDALLKLCSNSLFNTNFVIKNHIDWELVFNESINQSVAAIAFDGIKGIKLPEDIYKKWLMQSVQIVRNNYNVNGYHSILNDLMSQNGIPYCVLKGASSDYYYPKPMIRSMGDVDFLVPHDYFKKAIDIFIKSGFITRGEKEYVHTVFRKENMHFEMHFEPPGIPNNELRKIIEDYFKTIINESRLVYIEENAFINPSKFHHGLILLLHISHHLLREGIGLRHLCDWAVFVNSFKGREFVETFSDKLKLIGVWDFASILTVLSNKYLSLPLPEDIGTNFTKFDEFIEDIFVSGNFGKKKNSRYFESLYISSIDNPNSSYSKKKQFVRSINCIIFNKHNWLQNHKLFLPIFWIFYGLRYFVRYILGRRKSILNKEILDSANKRKYIYKDFHLFETEK